jgi:hypothetical protein
MRRPDVDQGGLARGRREARAGAACAREAAGLGAGDLSNVCGRLRRGEGLLRVVPHRAVVREGVGHGRDSRGGAAATTGGPSAAAGLRTQAGKNSGLSVSPTPRSHTASCALPPPPCISQYEKKKQSLFEAPAPHAPRSLPCTYQRAGA